MSMLTFDSKGKLVLSGAILGVLAAILAKTGNPGKNLRILASEAHVRTNVEKLLKSKKVNFSSREEGNEFVIETE